VQKKLDVLNQLRKNKIGPVKRLGTLSDTAPEKLWLTGYSESQQKVSISGVAFSEELIAEFMRRLQGSSDFTAVELVVSEQSDIAGTKVKKFQISCQLTTGL
jgi:type IV pilus assembly protein PilN